MGGNEHGCKTPRLEILLIELDLLIKKLYRVRWVPQACKTVSQEGPRVPRYVHNIAFLPAFTHPELIQCGVGR